MMGGYLLEVEKKHTLAGILCNNKDMGEGVKESEHSKITWCGAGYPLRLYKITLKWTGPDKILTKGQLESNLVYKKRTKYKKKTLSEIIT